MTQLEQVRAKTIEAVPEIAAGYVFYNADTDTRTEAQRPITLADVLRAIAFSKPPLMSMGTQAFVDAKGTKRPHFTMRKNTSLEVFFWNLALPLEEQSPGMIEFLYKILCV